MSDRKPQDLSIPRGELCAVLPDIKLCRMVFFIFFGISNFAFKHLQITNGSSCGSRVMKNISDGLQNSVMTRKHRILII